MCQAIFLYQFTSIVVTPWLLLTRLPAQAEKIVAFYHNNTMTNSSMHSSAFH